VGALSRAFPVIRTTASRTQIAPRVGTLTETAAQSASRQLSMDNCIPAHTPQDTPPLDAGTAGASATGDGAGRKLPQITVSDRQLVHIVADAWRAIHAANRPPQLYQRYGSLVRLRDGGQSLEIQVMDENAVYALLARRAVWVRRRESGRVANALPSREAARDMMALPDPSLPTLEGLVTVPVVGHRGELIASAGYHAEDRLFLSLPDTLAGLDVPVSPPVGDIAQARSLLLEELLGDFPFADQASRAHAMAAIVVSFVRAMIDGCTPLHLIEAPTPGSGKGLLCDVISTIVTGRRANARTLATNEDEARKMITAELSTSRPLILLDNTRQRHTLDSSPLASVITAEFWTDRLLGKSQMITVPNRALWLLNGNNAQLSMELARRCVRIRLDPKVDRPWLRQPREFRHPDLVQWAKDHRRELVWAALVLARAWVAAGRPRAATRLGSFESWSDVVGGILAVAGVPGFLSGVEAFYEAADAEGAAWREFTAVWWETFGTQPTRVADLLALCDRHDLMLEARGERGEQSQRTRLGQALQGMRDRVFGSLRIICVPDPRGKVSLYALRPVEAPSPQRRAGPAGPMPGLTDEGSASQDANVESPGETSQLSADRAGPAGPSSLSTHENSDGSFPCEEKARGPARPAGPALTPERPQEASGCAGPVPDLDQGPATATPGTVTDAERAGTGDLASSGDPESGDG
jgi:hypothetical protein